MAWSTEQIRGGGLIVDLLRERWRHATLYALERGPLQPGAVLDVFRAAATDKYNLAVFGEYGVYQECVHKHLADLFNGGLLAKRSVRAATSATFYELTDTAEGLLAAIGPAIDFGVAIFPELVELSQEFRGVDRVPVETPDVSSLPVEAVVHLRRRVAVLVFGVLLHPPWFLSVLAGLSGAPLRPSVLTEQINSAIAANADVLTTTSVSRSSVHAKLGRLHVLGYTRQVEDPAGRNPRRPAGAPEHASALTGRGRALLDALLPAADFGIAHDRELSTMARAVMRRRAVPPAGDNPRGGQ